jgi:cytochrome P450
MAMAMPADEPVQSFDLNDPEICANPYPAYRWLRENAPVHHLPGTSMWVLSRYQDIDRVLHDHETFSSYPGMEVPMLSLSLQDPPDHTRLRQTVSRAFTPRQIQQLASNIEAVAEELMAGLPSTCDFITAFANPLPLTIICEILGIPAERRRDMKRWSPATQSPKPWPSWPKAACAAHGTSGRKRWMAG